jgi:hypothetical protein
MFAFSFSEAPFGMEQITLLVHRQNKSNFGLQWHDNHEFIKQPTKHAKTIAFTIRNIAMDISQPKQVSNHFPKENI